MRRNYTMMKPNILSSNTIYNMFLVLCLLTTVLVEPILAQINCVYLRGFATCNGLLPTVSEMKTWSGTIELIIFSYKGELKTDRIVGNGDHFIRSMQLNNGELTGIQNQFFRRLTDGSLEQLHINVAGGSSKLDENAVDGLERSLTNLHVNSHTLTDVTGLALLTKLDKLTLTRTKLTELPDNFVRVIERVSRLKLSHNQLTTLPWDIVAQRLKDPRFLNVELAENNWHCDCKLKPILEATSFERTKIEQFVCQSPPELKNIGLEALRIASVCTAPVTTEAKKDQEPSKPDKDKVPGDKQASDKVTIDPKDKDPKDPNPTDPTPIVSTAGTISTSVIVAIIGGASIFLLIIIAAVCWKVKKNRSQSQGQQHTNKKYCSVIENNDGNGKNDGNADNEGRSSYNNGNNYDHPERQPLAPSYNNGNNHPDHRL